MARWQSESMRKVTTHFSIPTMIKEEMDKAGDRSDLLNQILEENLDRIMGGDVDRASQAREALIAEKVASFMRGNRDVLALSKEVEESMQEIFSCSKKIDSELDAPYKRLEKLKKDMEKLIQELRRERLEYRREREASIDTMLKSLMEDYELP